MAAVKVPTLDYLIKPMQQLKSLRPAMKLVVVEGASHTGIAGILPRPQVITEIRAFIAEQRKPAVSSSNY